MYPNIAAVALVCVFSHVTSTTSESITTQDAISLLSQRNPEHQHTDTDLSLSDLLNSKRTLLDIEQILEGLKRRRIRKRMCFIGAGVSSRCDDKGYVEAMYDRKFIEGADAPGKK